MKDNIVTFTDSYEKYLKFMGITLEEDVKRQLEVTKYFDKLHSTPKHVSDNTPRQWRGSLS
jgi:hypothetical protein